MDDLLEFDHELDALAMRLKDAEQIDSDSDRLQLLTLLEAKVRDLHRRISEAKEAKERALESQESDLQFRYRESD